MRPLYTTLFFLFLVSSVRAQCLTDFTKLLPEPSTDFTSGFGKSIAMHGDYLAVGIPTSDSLGRLTGLVNMYQKLPDNTWKKIASLAPSTPLDGLQFGWSLTMSEDYLLVGANGYGGKVYLFKKPSMGWTSQTEQKIFSIGGSKAFGVGHHNPIAISEDQETIAITDISQAVTTTAPFKYGVIYVYHKTVGMEWNAPITPVQVESPEGSVTDFGRAGVFIQEDRIITGTPFAPSGHGAIYIFKAPTSSFSSIVHEATLLSGTTNLFAYYNIAVTNKGIFASAYANTPSSPGAKILFFEKPISNEWINALPTCFLDPDNNSATNETLPFYLSGVGDDLFTSMKDSEGKGKFIKLTSGASGWCLPEMELIHSSNPSESQLNGSVPNNYGYVNSASAANTAAIGYVGNPANEYSQAALRIFAKNASELVWSSQLLYNTKKSTAGHRYGQSVLGFDDYLFIGAPNDATLKPYGGAVYTFKKQGGSWQQINKIIPPYAAKYDDVFGSALASNGNQLAIGALGFDPIGKVFIYNKSGSDWLGPTLAQEIVLPDTLDIGEYGDNLAMNDQWLIIPFVGSTSVKMTLAIYKFNGGDWEFDHVADVGYGNFFSKTSTIAVAIENDVLLAGGNLLKLNESGKWEVQHTLSPSDPEPLQIKPDFSGWVTNGSLFGHSVSIQDNTIFIGAPTRDYQGIWDVGAVYVYTKLPGESWTSRTETTKLLPRVKNERELFGYSLKNLHNTLIVGAPGADYNKDEYTPRNRPGRSYVFQSVDYFWKDVISLLDFTGDSYIKDYYGIAVGLDETDFFIGASIEDVGSDKLSGSVYITPTPPLVKLVPPVCFTSSPQTLFGYPFGGTWSGPGIIDGSTGQFDPAIAGVGIHEITYKTVSCTYEGKLRIEVEGPPLAKLLSPPITRVCKNQSFSIPLSVEEEANCTYQWYHRSTPQDEFQPLEIHTPSMLATLLGEFRVEVRNRSCTTLSSIVRMEHEEVSFSYNIPSALCTDFQNDIDLAVEPTGGVWSGLGVKSNKLNVKGLTTTSLELVYTYRSVNGCTFKDTVYIQLQHIVTPQLKREQGDLCKEGVVTLSLTNLPSEYSSLQWVYTENKESPASNIDLKLPSIQITKFGIYQATVSTDVCSASSNQLIIDDQFSIDMNPSNTLIKACNSDLVVLELTNMENANYSWFLHNKEDDSKAVMDAHNSSLLIKASGSYSAKVTRGQCTFSSATYDVEFTPQDSVFVPNVFTPNGDGKNDEFRIHTMAQNVDFLILNRYGGRILSGNENSIWKGQDESPGVYFWFVTYVNCQQERKILKGTVHLIK